MTITLNPDQEAWLQARVAEGEFPSVEAALFAVLEERIAGEEVADDDSWVQPYIDEGAAALDRGEFVTLEEHKKFLASLLASLEP